MTTGEPPQPPDPSRPESAEAALRESDARFRVLVQNIRDYAVMMLDPQGRVTAWNEGAARLKLYSEEEIVGQHFSIFYPPEELAQGRPEQEIRTAEAEGRSEVEGFRVRRDGSRFWVNEIVTAIRDDEGRLRGFAKISRDLTETKRIRDALSESEERYRLLVENVRDYAIFMMDGAGRVVTWNPGARRIFGYEEAEIIGRDGSILFTPEDQATGEHEKELGTALAEGRAVDERWQMRKDGSRFWASGVSTAMRDASGGVRGFSKVCRDLTERRLVEQQRERLLEQEMRARMEAERAITMKDEFLATVSHELRTPLTAILLWSRLLRSGALGDDDEQRARALDTIEQSAVAQQQLIEDLLDISRIVSGKLRLNVRDAEAAPVVQAAVEAVRPMADARGVAIESSLDAGAGRVRADPDRLQQVVWNLLNNAAKFTPEGGRVVVRLERVDRALRVQVTDTGKGIAPEFLPHVFERFRQADASTTRQHGGLGLGLAISQQLVELHGGTIRADSPGEGLGATFTVELPLADVRHDAGSPAAGAAPPAGPTVALRAPFAPSPLLRGVRVLVVENEPGTRTVIRWLLEQCQAEVTAAESAAHALDAFRASLDGRPYDVLVSDIGMPGQDGYELIRQIRALETQRAAARPVPAVALTAYARDDDRRHAEAAGFQAHLPKPVEPAALVETVANLAGPSHDAATGL